MINLSKEELLYLSNLLFDDLGKAREYRRKFVSEELKVTLSATELFLENLYKKIIDLEEQNEKKV